MDEAKRIAKEFLIVDAHVDVPYRLAAKPADVSAATDDGDFDYPRAVAGGLNAPFMSIYTSADSADKGEAYALANQLIDSVEALVVSHPDKFAIALSPADVRAQFEAGLISLPMGMENGSPLDGKLENVAYFFERGIRYITLAHAQEQPARGFFLRLQPAVGRAQRVRRRGSARDESPGRDGGRQPPVRRRFP